jgi:Tol biopolymer transport system component
MKKHMFISIALSALFLLIIGVEYRNYTISNIPHGQIVLRIKSQNANFGSDIIVMDGSGNNIRWVGNYEGSPTWSPDGRFIAVGCDNSVCILDVATIPDRRNKLGNQNLLPDVAYKIPTPQLCNSMAAYGEGKSYSGILSMSWSPDGENLAVVCGDETPEQSRLVCILSLKGNTNCWDKEFSKNIYRIAWSPVDKNVIAIAGPGDGGTSTKIYLVNSKGENPVYLTYGWSPEWSPTGDEIAFISDEPGRLGIGAISKNGTERSWLYISTLKPREELIYFDCRGISGTCRLSWSPDKRFITFVSSNLDIYSYRLYRLEIKTGNIIRLIDSQIFKHVAEPDWGP